jgi:hypothetical protein
MRRPLTLSALAVFASALCLAHGEPPKPSPGPSKELVDTACSSGLLLQRPDDAEADAAPDDDADGGAFSGAPGLFGSSDDGGEKKDGAKKPAAPEKKKKPKTKLLKPRSDKDAANCPDQVRGFYAKYGDQFSAVPAPANIDTASIEKNIDHVFDVASGPAQKQMLKDLKGEDIAAKTKVVNKIFDGVTVNGVTTLDEAAFGTKVALNLHEIATDKTGAFLVGKPGAAPQTPEQAAAKAAADKKASAAAAAAAPDVYTAAPGAGLPGGLPRNSSVPDVRPVPAAKEAWTGPANEVPAEPGYLRRKLNDYTAVARDVVSGQPIATEMGWASGVANPFLHNTTPAQLSGVAGVDKMLPAGIPGQSRECGRGGNGDYACWGTKDMVAILASMGQKYAAYFKNIGGTEKIRIGDISREGGGYLAGHVSHQRGVDVDLRFVGGRGGFNVQANSMVIAALMLSVPNYRNIPGQQMILVDQSLHGAVGAGLDKLVAEKVITADEASRAKASLRHWPGHRDHFHLRIKLGDAKAAPQVPGSVPAADAEAD